MHQKHSLVSKELWPSYQAILLCEDLPADKQNVFVQGNAGYYCVQQAKQAGQYCVKFFKQVN